MAIQVAEGAHRANFAALPYAYFRPLLLPYFK